MLRLDIVRMCETRDWDIFQTIEQYERVWELCVAGGHDLCCVSYSSHSTLKLDADMARIRSYLGNPWFYFINSKKGLLRFYHLCWKMVIKHFWSIQNQHIQILLLTINGILANFIMSASLLLPVTECSVMMWANININITLSRTQRYHKMTSLYKYFFCFRMFELWLAGWWHGGDWHWSASNSSQWWHSWWWWCQSEEWTKKRT